MSVSTIQKITFISCLVLCVSLFLPKIFLSRGKKGIVQSEVGPGHIPPLRYSQPYTEDHDPGLAESMYTKPFNPDVISRTKGARKPNLLGQVIPVYGFGIFLYIIYIFFKLTYKDRSPKEECRSTLMTLEHAVQEMPDYEMAQLQARLRQMEGMREKGASKAIHLPTRSCRSNRRREERKLRQLRQVTHVILEGRPLEGVSPEVEAEETPYSSDWEGYSEETYPKYEVTFRTRRFPSVILEEADVDMPTAEELAERMGREEEVDGEDDDEDYEIDEQENEVGIGADEDKEDVAKDYPPELQEGADAKRSEDDEDEESEDDEDEAKEVHNGELIEDDDDYEDSDHHTNEEQEEEEEEEEEEVGEDQPCLPHHSDDEEQGLQCKGERKHRGAPSNRKQITFSDHRHVFHYPKGGAVGCKYEDEEEEEDDSEEDKDATKEDDEEEEEEDEEVEDKQNEDDQKEVLGREEEDPLMEAESLGFHTEAECDPEEQEVDLLDFLLTYQPEAVVTPSQPMSPRAPVPSTLRMRHKKQKKKN